jgi:protein-tyrosine phosphatase
VSVGSAGPGLSLGLEKATNARDLGGYRTADGRTIRAGVLYRANALNRLSAADIASVGRLGLACVIDFRHQREIELVGADRLPDPAPRVVPLPLFDPDHDVFTSVNAVVRGLAGDEALAHLRDDADTGGARVMMLELYRRFVHSPQIRAVFATAMRLVADPAELPLLFHCTAGKDRTGWLAALVLSALGVDRDTIMADYLRTTELNASGRDYMLSTLSGRITQPDVILPLIEARAEYLQAGFDEADKVYGGMDGYLREGLGLDDDVLAALRANLLE